MSKQDSKKKDKDNHLLVNLVIDAFIVIAILLIINCVKCNTDKFKKEQEASLSSEDDVSSFSAIRVNDYLIEAANNCLINDGKSTLEATSVVSLYFNEITNQLNYTTFVSDETDKLLSIKLTMNQNNLEGALEEINENHIDLNQHTYESAYLNVVNNDSFVNSSNFKTNITSNISLYNIGKTNTLDPSYYFFGTYQENSSYVSINGLEFDNGTNEFLTTNIKKEIASNGRSYLYLKHICNFY